MKIVKHLLAMLLIFAVLLSTAGCYFVSSQRMYRVKGTYKLTNYTYTPSYERKEGYTPIQRDYVNGEEYMYEDYLIITGNGKGYYVHKEVGSDPYVKEITLSYEYDSENSSKVSYIVYNDALTVNKTDGGLNRLGVAKNNLNYSKSSIDYTELFTKRPMRSESLSVRWEKVSRAIDLSYAEKELGSLKYYDYNSFATRGIYEISSQSEIETGIVLDSPYQYFFYVIDTASGATNATAHYAMKDAPGNKITKTVSISKTADDWSTFTLDGKTWTRENSIGAYYYSEADGIKTSLTCMNNDISPKALEYMINGRLPQETE